LRLLGFGWDDHMTAQVHERLIFDGEDASMACCPPLPGGHARIVHSDPAEVAGDDALILFSTGCWRRYIGTWEIKGGRFFLVGIRGVYKLLGEEPLLADWFTGILKVPRGNVLHYVHGNFLSVYEEEIHVQIENGVMVDSRVIDNRPHLGPAAEHYQQGQAWRLKGEYEKAIAAFSEAVRLHPPYPDAYYLRGLAYEAIADYDRSLADLKKVVQLQPGVVQGRSWEIASKDIDYDIARVCCRRGTASFQKGEFGAALADFNESIELDPQPDFRLARGRAYYALRRFKEAIDDLMAIAVTNPEDKLLRFDIYYRLATCHREIGAYKLAILNAGIAIRLDPNSTEAYYVRGGAYLGMGEHDKAIADLTEAIRLRSGWTDAYVDRAKAYRAIGDETRATEDTAKAGEMPP